MFSVTYLGHQGWLVQGGRSRILVDPLLTAEYSPGFQAEIYPPRTFDHRKFPAIDAVVLSHEHADHLNLPSLALLDRQIPIILPARSARALHDAVAGLGFRVVPSRTGDTFAVGELEVTLLGGVAPGAQLDWEVTNLQILIADRARHGSFFTYVDTWPTAQTLELVRRKVGALGILCHANNVMDWSCLEAGPGGAPPVTALGFVAELADAEASWWRGGEAPAVSVVCGPGLAFRGDDAWMNQILCVDPERVRDALHAAAPERTFRAPIAGETIELVRGAVRRIAPHTPFVRAPDRAAWPSLRVAARRALIEDFPPACGERSLDDAAWPYVLAELDQLAAFLYRRDLFHGVLALDGRAPGKRKPAFALVLRCDDADTAQVLEYQPEASRFAIVAAARPLETYALGLECWASDLWRVLVGRMLPQRLLGHLRTWSFAPAPLSPLFGVWGFFDALYRPAAAAAFYGALVDQLRGQPAQIAAGRHARRVKRLRR
jgi:Beta-lactamase superfamily domain